jgi:hypothetical protein
MVTPDTVPAKVWAPSHHWRPRWPACVQTARRNWQNLLKSFRAFLLFFVARQAEADPHRVRCGWVFSLVEWGALGTAPWYRAGDPNSVQGAPAVGAPPPGIPPRWAPVGPSAVVSAAHEPGRVGCRLWGVGAAFWCPKWLVPLSRLFGGGLESHRSPLKSVGTASGWCGVGHHHVPAKCTRGYPRKRPGSTPNPKSGSPVRLQNWPTFI